jgi:hypothetical protein
MRNKIKILKVGLCCEVSKLSGEKSNTSIINRRFRLWELVYNVRETFLEKKGEKSEREKNQGRAAILLLPGKGETNFQYY